MKLRTPVLVTWTDACSYHDSPDEDWIEEVQSIGGFLTRSVGFLVARNRRSIVISATLHEDEPHTVLCIPKGMIKSIEVLECQDQKN